MTDAPMTPDRVRADALQPGDQIRHQCDWTLFTVSSVETLDSIGSPLDFHNRKTDEMERGLRVTGTDADGETVHVDCAPSYLWHREGRQATTPMTPDREQEIRTLDLLSLMSDRAAPVISGHLVVLLAEVDRLRARVAELEGAVPENSLCGKTESTSGGVYAPCVRPAGHTEAYCRATPHTHYFLAADTSQEDKR